MTAHRLQTALWAVFLIYYFAAKYFVGGFTGFSVSYLVSVIILVALTAVVPYYAARWVSGKLEDAAKIASVLLVPTVMTCVGLSLYFLLYIAPSYPNIQLPNIIHRAFEPGIAISLLLLIPSIAKLISRSSDNGAETAS